MDTDLAARIDRMVHILDAVRGDDTWRRAKPRRISYHGLLRAIHSHTFDAFDTGLITNAEIREDLRLLEKEELLELHRTPTATGWARETWSYCGPDYDRSLGHYPWLKSLVVRALGEV